MKKVLIFIVGFSPLLIGCGLNLFINHSTSGNLGFILDVFSLIFFLYWGVLGVVFSKVTGSKVIASIMCNLPAFLVLVLILVQELINKQYWANYLGLATQFFYLPALRMGMKVTPGFLHYVWQIHSFSFLLMVIVFYLGCLISAKRNSHI